MELSKIGKEILKIINEKENILNPDDMAFLGLTLFLAIRKQLINIEKAQNADSLIIYALPDRNGKTYIFPVYYN